MEQPEVIQTVRQHQGEFTEVYSVQSLALFGSVARNEAGPLSDIDMLVEFNAVELNPIICWSPLLKP